VLITRVSLHNDAEIARLDIAVGDRIVIALVGDVIPQVVEVVGRSARSAIPTERSTPQLAESMPNGCLGDSPECRERFLARAAYFVSKPGLNIAGLGRKRLRRLVEAGLVIDLPSFFQLKPEAVAAVPGFGWDAARRLTAAISDAGHSGHFRLVAALGITGVGPKTVQRLNRRFFSLDELLTAELNQSPALSTADKRAVKSIREFFKTPPGDELLRKFRELGLL
jgi:DNA ligase (NAD+)